MCQHLKQITAAMRGYSTGFDASRLTCADAATVVKDASAIEHMAATVKALAAARAAEAKTWKGSGHRSAQEQLAHDTGTTVAGAREALNLGRRLAAQPEVAAAARTGELSPAQASAITDAVDADPTAARNLLDTARAGGSVAELRDRCAAVKAAATDLDDRRREIHRQRRLRSWTDQGGTWHLVGQGSPEHGAQIIAALAPFANEAFQDARAEGRREHPDAYRFDALVRLALNSTSLGDATADDGGADDHDRANSDDTADARDVPSAPTAASGPASAPSGPVPAPTGSENPSGDPGLAVADRPTVVDTIGRVDNEPSPSHPDLAGPPSGRRPVRKRSSTPTSRRRRGAPVKLLIRVDLETFLRGFPADGETCDLVGYGPISMSAVKDLLNDGDPFVAAILTKGKQVLGVAHLGRQPTSHQRSALEWLHPTCAVAGCPCSARLEIDHRIDWARSHLTLLDWLDSLCHHHHALKTRYGWSLVDGVGKRPFVPPTDPRHPRSASAREDSETRE